MPPVDVFSEAQGLQRRRALLQALQQRAASPQIQGTPGQGIAQLLAALGTSYVANQGLDRLDQQEAGNQARYQEGLAGELERFMRTSQGTPDEVMPQGVMGPPQLGMEADPKAAVLAAMTSRYPEMQGVGKAMLPGLLEKPKEPKFGNWQDRGDGTIFRTDPTTGEIEVRRGVLPPKKTDPMVQIDNYPKAEEKAAGAQHDQLMPGGKLYEQAQAAQEYIDTAKEAVVSLRNAKPGTGESWIGPIRGFVARFTGADPSTIDTQTLGSQLANLTLKAAGGSFGNQVSDGDRKFIAEANGAVNMTPEAIKRVLAIQTAVAIKRQFPYMRAMETVAGRGGAFAGVRDFGVSINNNIEGLDPEFQRMVENVLQGKDSTAGLPEVPISGVPNRVPRGGSGITYTPRGGR